MCQHVGPMPPLASSSPNRYHRQQLARFADYSPWTARPRLFHRLAHPDWTRWRRPFCSFGKASRSSQFAVEPTPHSRLFHLRTSQTRAWPPCATTSPKDEPKKASRPFDRERDSGVISEGAGVLVLETLRHALARGARPCAEITGFASCNDPVPGEHGAGLADCMRRAVAHAGRRNSAR